MRRNFASGFRAGFVLLVRWIPSDLNYSGKGSRFLDPDHDPSKSLLHVIAQRLTRSVRASGIEREGSLSHTDAGANQVHHGSHIHEPSASVQSTASSDDLSSLAGRAAALPNGLAIPGWMFASVIPECKGLMTLASLARCELPPGLVGSQLLGESQIRWSSAWTGTEARHKDRRKSPSCSISGTLIQTPNTLRE